MKTKKNRITQIISNNSLNDKIYYLRGKHVMFDRDLALLFGVEPRVLNQAVKRNIERFPERYMFQLTKKETESLKSQIVTLKKGRGQHQKYLSYVFTEHGVSQLPSVLKSKKAIQVSIQIIDTFIALREMVNNQGLFIEQIAEFERKFIKQDQTNKEIFKAINLLIQQIPARTSIKDLISNGENDYVEFKSTLRFNLHTKKNDKAIEYAVLKTIAGFLNKNGGVLLVGVSDEGEVIGLKNDKFLNTDKMMLHLVNLIKSNISTYHASEVTQIIEEINKKYILRVDCKRSSQPAYVKKDKDKKLYVRVGPSTAELPIDEIHGYIESRFKKK